MEIILCNTNLAVTTCVCQIKLNSHQRFVVFTDLPNIEKFFKLISLKNVDLYFVDSTHHYWDLYSVFQSKKEVIKILERYNRIEKIHLYHQGYGGFYNWIISYVHNKGAKVQYNELLPRGNFPKASFSLSYLKIWFKYRVLYCSQIEIVDRGDKNLAPRINNLFYKKNNIRIVKTPIESNIINEISDIILTHIRIPITNSSILFLTGSVLDTGQVFVNEYTTKTERLINLIGSQNIVCKCHPRFNDEILAETKIQHIPSFIPMEFILNKFRIYMGYNSTVLRHAAEQNCIAISLINYYIPTSVERRNKWYDHFHGTNVKFPSNEEELKHLLSDSFNI